MDHFNKLTPAEQERLAILVEEASEVIKAAMKILRHGYESTNPDTKFLTDNRRDLEIELGHFTLAYDNMIDCRDIDLAAVDNAAFLKHSRPNSYTHHQD